MSSESSSLQPTSEPTENAIAATHRDPSEAVFPIVGVAASAGGLQAFTQLLSHLPTDTGMAFVLIQHLSPDHESLLTEILARTTQLPVREVQDGVTVEPNQVYVIPPNTKMILSEGVLKLSPREKVSGKYMPGDTFFTSLAGDRGHKAIAVVLSGGDGDGSLGLKAIKAAGGVTFAQCEDTAQFDSMPHTAVATGDVDFVLPPEKIAEELVNLSRNPMLASPVPLISPEVLVKPINGLATIFALLRAATGVDFSRYKPNTLDRRIRRRMVLYKLEQLEDYATYLQNHPDEVKALHEEILIHVTSFFRDPDVFEQLKTHVFPTIIQNKSADAPIRIWVAGCSTGEEAYSIAICLIEFLGDRAMHLPIQIFATDISGLAIDKSREAIYQDNQMVDVSAERRRQFFGVREHGSYQISKAVRELCIFARQDLGSDPPFSNIDLISCRNVLIYLGDTLQQRIMTLFHYSLNPTGFLLLGTSEGTGNYANLFTLVEKKCRIYAKQLTATQPIVSFTPSSYSAVKGDDGSAASSDRQLRQAAPEEFDVQKKVDQLILSHYAPVGVVIDAKMQVLQLRGEVDRYLKLVSGTANLNLFNLVRAGLLVELRAAVYQAQRLELPVTKTGVQMPESAPFALQDGQAAEPQGQRVRTVDLQVIPFKVPNIEESRFLVLFEDAPPAVYSVSAVDLTDAQRDVAQQNVRLKQELATAIQERAATQEYLQTVIKEQEHSNQDLNVANEEILSSNEELQSTNEELETAKEEIQATNEELNTVNEELRSRNLELHRLNNDLTNLWDSINIPILMLTNDLRIRRFTPMALRLFNFIAADAGRPLSDLRANLKIPDLEPLILEVLETLSVKELDVQTQGGYWYTLRIRPYRTSENQIDGVVLVLLDIDALKRSSATLEDARNYAEAIVETVQVPLLVLESNFRVNTANRSFYETFQATPAETVQALIFELGSGQWNCPELRSRLDGILANDTTLQNFEVQQDFERIGQKTMQLNALKIIQDNGAQQILLSIEDITGRKQFEAERSQLLTQEQAARQEAEAANRAKDEFLSNLSHELRNPLSIMLGWAQILRTGQLDAVAVGGALEVIERSARTQSQLIEDMLDISRITSGKLHLTMQLIDLAAVVETAIESVQFSAAAKSIQLSSQLTATTVWGDVDRLQQVLWNLLGNAIKFTLPGGRVNVTVAPGQTDAVIRVSDTGQGIRAELLPYVFDRFRQGDASTTKATQGLGLGLSIVRYIVESHGGTVQAESPGSGQGTTMVVRLPLRSPVPNELTNELTSELANELASELASEPQAKLQAGRSQPPTATSASNQAAADPTANQPLEAVGQAVAELEGVCILVVDDDVDNLDLLKYILAVAGADVVPLTSARDAIAALRAAPERYDVLLADIGMPDEDGIDLIRQVRALDATAGGQIPAAAITAYVSEQEQQLAIDAGFQQYLAKPINPAQIVSTVATLVEHGSRSADSEA